jgi:ribulose 1,5-bisphosphate synthetase/thiazole synthase
LKTLQRPAREVPVRYEPEVVVVGGGSAGVASAVSAAREGAKTLLIERAGFLGGVMTVTSLGGICGLYSLVDGEPRQLVFGFAEEVRQRLERRGATRGPLAWLKTASLPYDLQQMKEVCDDLVR